MYRSGPMVLWRRADQTWLQAALTVATQHGLEAVVEAAYFELVDNGCPADVAAFEALYELDFDLWGTGQDRGVVIDA